jgi:DNA-binding SARP family transcriptional activator
LFCRGRSGGPEELRLVAVMDRVDADLALGAGGAMVPELESLVASEPPQERLLGQLMLALYRVGRQANALAVYRELSGLLRDGLGLVSGEDYAPFSRRSQAPPAGRRRRL